MKLLALYHEHLDSAIFLFLVSSLYHSHVGIPTVGSERLQNSMSKVIVTTAPRFSFYVSDWWVIQYECE
jgi:hypothetical protein